MFLSFQSISADLFTIICSQTFTGKTQISFLIVIMEISQLQRCYQKDGKLYHLAKFMVLVSTSNFFDQKHFYWNPPIEVLYHKLKYLCAIVYPKT